MRADDRTDDLILLAHLIVKDLLLLRQVVAIATWVYSLIALLQGKDVTLGWGCLLVQQRGPNRWCRIAESVRSMSGVLAHTTILWLKRIVDVGRLTTSASVIDVRRLSIAQIDVFKGFLLALLALLHLHLLCSSFVKNSHGPLAPTHS